MNVWVVMDGDYDSAWICGIYDNEAAALAHEHAKMTWKPEVFKVRVQFVDPDRST